MQKPKQGYKIVKLLVFTPLTGMMDDVVSLLFVLGPGIF